MAGKGKSRPMKVEIYGDRHGEWRWRVIASNGNIVADGGEGYTTRAGAIRGWGSFVTRAQRAEIIGRDLPDPPQPKIGSPLRSGA